MRRASRRAEGGEEEGMAGRDAGGESVRPWRGRSRRDGAGSSNSKPDASTVTPLPVGHRNIQRDVCAARLHFRIPPARCQATHEPYNGLTPLRDAGGESVRSWRGRSRRDRADVSGSKPDVSTVTPLPLGHRNIQRDVCAAWLLFRIPPATCQDTNERYYGLTPLLSRHKRTILWFDPFTKWRRSLSRRFVRLKAGVSTVSPRAHPARSGVSTV